MFSTLAYGGFHSTEFVGMLVECLPALAITLLPVVLLYFICSAIAQCAPWRWLGIPMYIVAIALLAQRSGAMGEYGPAHKATATFPYAAGLFLILLAGKTLLLYCRVKQRVNSYKSTK